jgi:putative acetyltransferase
MRIELDDVTRPEVLELLEEHLRNMYELSPPDQVFAFDASKLRAPSITFWTAWENETLLGCAALKHISILVVSRKRGYQKLFLETGRHAAFAPAHALYRSVGFHECGPFNGYKENGNSVFMSLTLGAEDAV